MTTTEALKEIIPGKTYPAEVTVSEEVNGTPMVVKFCFNSFYVGMYCCIYINGNVAQQGGDRNNKSCMTSLKKDLKRALSRGAKVEIGDIRNVISSI
jgi:hypothetical protein